MIEYRCGYGVGFLTGCILVGLAALDLLLAAWHRLIEVLRD